MTRPAAYRGQPVLVLLVVAAGWSGTRIMLWDVPFPAAQEIRAPAVLAENDAAGGRLVRTLDQAALQAPAAPGSWSFAFTGRPDTALPPFDDGVPRWPAKISSVAQSLMPVLQGIDVAGRTAIPPFPTLSEGSAQPDRGRWSGDAWVLVRNDTITPITSGRGSYGRSQAGAVLRYRLVPSSGYRPTAYLRASTAIDGPREAEVAVGVSGRPLPRVPLVLAAEVRGARFASDTQARPAVFAYSEFVPVELPFGTRGEAYLQAGYIGGGFATPFVDGQIRIDRPIVRIGPADLRAGGGLWGGAQKGAERLDAGPGATLALDVAGAPVRVSADWRFRVAGEANPSSGPALTVSAGF